MTLFIPPTEGGFSRLQAAKQTLISWGRHMKYPGALALHIANDSVDLDDSEVVRLATFSPWPEVVSHTKGKGLGGALNEGLKAAFKCSPLAIYADDSYSLVEDLDLMPWASVLMQNEDLGAVSLMPPRPDQRGGQTLYFHNIRTEGVAGVVFERQAYAWNGRPLLYHKRFFDYYGLTKEYCSGYEWEREFAERYVQMSGGPSVLYAFHDPWQHVWGGVRLGDKEPGWSG